MTDRRSAVAIGRLLVVVAAMALLALEGGPERGLPRLASWGALLIALIVTTIEVAVRLGLTEHETLRAESSARLMRGWLAANSEESEPARLEVFRQVFYDGQKARTRRGRYVLLMIFASVIATVGVIADSTAVVIGAMLIAPLITPMMGMALGLVMGWGSRLIRSTGLVAAGIIIAIATGWILPFVVTTGIDPSINTQILSRATPTLLDLIVAIAAGAAGSYAISRPDVSSSLPGVAIAIALVPPLAVVGITLQAQQWEQAAGSALLFTTNMIAILITGGIVFLVTGIAPIERLNESQDRFRVALTSLVLLALAVAGALAANGASITRDGLALDDARAATVEWLGEDSEFGLVSLVIADADVAIVLAGPGNPVAPQDLASAIADVLGRPIVLDLQWIPRQQLIIRQTDGGG